MPPVGGCLYYIVPNLRQATICSIMIDMKDTKERWRDFPEDRRYQASTFGRLRRKSNKRIRICSIKLNGYRGVVFTTPGVRGAKGYDLHVIIALTWLGPRPEKHEVSHQDHDKLNNNVSNLKYETHQANTSKACQKYCNGKRVLTEQDVLAIRADTILSNKEWGLRLGVLPRTVWKVRKRLLWKYV